MADPSTPATPPAPSVPTSPNLQIIRAAADALRLITMDPVISAWLGAQDPKALAQVAEALGGLQTLENDPTIGYVWSDLFGGRTPIFKIRIPRGWTPEKARGTVAEVLARLRASYRWIKADVISNCVEVCYGEPDWETIQAEINAAIYRMTQ